MLPIQVPGRKSFTIHHLVLDFNGTLAQDGKVISGVEKRLRELSEHLKVYVITADTNGSVEEECSNLPVDIHVIKKENQLDEKKVFVQNLTPSGTVSIGNGSNDEEMFVESDLAFAVLGSEGCATSTLLKSDVAVQHINDALDLLLQQNRLIATLRK